MNRAHTLPTFLLSISSIKLLSFSSSDAIKLCCSLWYKIKKKFKLVSALKANNINTQPLPSKTCPSQGCKDSGFWHETLAFMSHLTANHTHGERLGIKHGGYRGLPTQKRTRQRKATPPREVKQAYIISVYLEHRRPVLYVCRVITFR